MKLLTANFLTCAVKTCKTSPKSFPLHFRDAELEQVPMDFNPLFLTNLLPRLEWDALRISAAELGFTTLPETKPDFLPATAEVMDAVVEGADVDMEGASSPPPSDLETTAASGSAAAGSSAPLNPKDEQLLRDLHRLLLETQVREGKMVCGNCGFEYKIKEGIPNFLLPSHLV